MCYMKHYTCVKALNGKLDNPIDDVFRQVVIKDPETADYVNTIQLVSRWKREARTCAKKFCEIDSHTACLPKSKNVKSGGVSAGDQKIIVDDHNKHRADVQPTAADMLKMTWDDELAKIAQAWSDNCVINHDPAYRRAIPGRMPVGQNLGYNYTTWSGVIQAWFDEKDDYDFNTGSAIGNKVVGHYTQLAWASSSKIGCGFTVCDVTKFYACNYGPGGNVAGDKPYTSGSSCDNCRGHCDKKLCDCGTVVCENGGKLDLATCKCNCTRSYHVGKECKLDCDKVTEPFYCGNGQYDKKGCIVYAEVPRDCPNLCDVCPYGGYNYNGAEVAIDKCSTSSPPHDSSSGSTTFPTTVILLTAMFYMLNTAFIENLVKTSFN